MKKLNIIFMLLIVPICTMAQERLTLDECLELAKSHNKRIEASNFQIESAKYIIAKTKCSKIQNQTRLFDLKGQSNRNATTI